MRINTRYDKAIGDLKQTNISAPPGLLAFPAAPKKRWARPASLIAGGTAAAAVMAAFLLPASAIGLEEIGQALKSVPASHAQFFRQGKLQQENWKEGKKRRFRNKTFGPWSPKNFDYEGGQIDGKAWYVQPEFGYAVFEPELSRMHGEMGPNLEDEINRAMRTGQVKPFREDRKVVVDGEELFQITFRPRDARGNPMNQKSVYLCRPEDKLPVRVEYSTVFQGKEVINGYWTIEYPDDIPDELFQPTIPRGFPVLDHLKAIAQIRARLHDPAYRKVVDGITIKLLGIFPELSNTVNILYTGGEAPPLDARAGLLNERGQGYRVSSEFESDDRNRPRNHGIASPLAKPAKNREVKFHGMSPDFPIDIRPYMYLDGTPIYCIRAMVEPDIFKNPTKMTAIVPVVKKAGTDIRRIGTKGIYVRGTGKQVGVAKFDDVTVSVLVMGFLVRDLDKNRLSSTTALPLQSINVNSAHLKKVMAERMK